MNSYPKKQVKYVWKYILRMLDELGLDKTLNQVESIDMNELTRDSGLMH